jgi:hypothetical protein
MIDTPNDGYLAETESEHYDKLDKAAERTIWVENKAKEIRDDVKTYSHSELINFCMGLANEIDAVHHLGHLMTFAFRYPQARSYQYADTVILTYCFQLAEQAAKDEGL